MTASAVRHRSYGFSFIFIAFSPSRNFLARVRGFASWPLQIFFGRLHNLPAIEMNSAPFSRRSSCRARAEVEGPLPLQLRGISKSRVTALGMLRDRDRHGSSHVKPFQTQGGLKISGEIIFGRYPTSHCSHCVLGSQWLDFYLGYPGMGTIPVFC